MVWCKLYLWARFVAMLITRVRRGEKIWMNNCAYKISTLLDHPNSVIMTPKFSGFKSFDFSFIVSIVDLWQGWLDHRWSSWPKKYIRPHTNAIQRFSREDFSCVYHFHHHQSLAILRISSLSFDSELFTYKAISSFQTDNPLSFYFLAFILFNCIQLLNSELILLCIFLYFIR